MRARRGNVAGFGHEKSSFIEPMSLTEGVVMGVKIRQSQKVLFLFYYSMYIYNNSQILVKEKFTSL